MLTETNPRCLKCGSTELTTRRYSDESPILLCDACFKYFFDELSTRDSASELTYLELNRDGRSLPKWLHSLVVDIVYPVASIVWAIKTVRRKSALAWRYLITLIAGFMLINGTKLLLYIMTLNQKIDQKTVDAIKETIESLKDK